MDLTVARRAARNPDGVVFYKIWNGRQKPKMPAAEERPDQRTGLADRQLRADAAREAVAIGHMQLR